MFVAFLLVSIEAVDEVFTPTPNFPRSPNEFLIKPVLKFDSRSKLSALRGRSEGSGLDSVSS